MTSNLSNSSFANRDSLISVRKKRIASDRDIPTQVCFELTNSDLKTFKEQKNRSLKLNLSSELLADLRYYGLLQNPRSLESQLIFTTYYVSQQKKIAVIKTIICLRGKISQQISRHFLDRPQLLQELVTNHYWLIDQISDRFFFHYKSKSAFLTWMLPFVIVLIVAPFLLYLFTINWLIKLILLAIIWFLSYLTINFVIKRYLASFTLRQLLFGFFSKNTARRHLGFMLLRYFG